MAKYARVLVDQSGSHIFDYEIPAAWAARVQIGSRVAVPIRTRTAMATVIDLLDATEIQNVRSIERVVSEKPVLNPQLLKLGHWIADYYCCPLDITMHTLLPQVIRKAEISYKKRLFARLIHAVANDELLALEKRAPKQAEVIRFLNERGSLTAISQITKECGVTHQTVHQLAKKNLVELSSESVLRDPNEGETFLHSPKHELNGEQKIVFEQVKKAMDDAGSESRSARPILLHGVTGSGKTEIYLQAIELALERGQTAIMLVPEIALTPQMVERFKSRFANRQTDVAVLHSHLSEGERHDEWHKINNGVARIVIGARSAIFAPLQNIGLIVVDEEHENSYKQEEAPRYHGRDVAVLRAALEGCAIILGSATPSLESYHNAMSGKYQLFHLTQRAQEQKMPKIRIIDMRMESKNARSVISEKLITALSDRIAKREQSMLFLNRRGFSTSLICAACGYVCECPNCSLALTFHRSSARIICHMCGHTAIAPAKCPECGDPGIRYSGTGTEKVEEIVSKIFSKAVVKRMDADTMTRKGAYREVLGDFRTGKIDILVGTQMIAKGLHFPNVTLVGIINADLALHLPDFRAGERTFQLLTQVAGRAGRGDVEGEVFVQSFTPHSPSIQFARHHDFEGFREQEIEFREKWDYPPFTHMALITIRSPHQQKAEFSAETLARKLKEALPLGTTLSDPAPAPLEKSHGNYRFHLMLRSNAILKLSRKLREILNTLTFPEEVIVSVDIDPYQLM